MYRSLFACVVAEPQSCATFANALMSEDDKDITELQKDLTARCRLKRVFVCKIQAMERGLRIRGDVERLLQA